LELAISPEAAGGEIVGDGTFIFLPSGYKKKFEWGALFLASEM
jgi:hypothetical protein